MKPDPSRRTPPPSGALEAVVAAARRRRARGAAVVGVGVAALGAAAVLLVPSGDGGPSEQLAGPPGAVVTPSSVATTVPPSKPALGAAADQRCPQEPSGVPAAQGFDDAASLVPDEVPAEVLLCRYEHQDVGRSWTVTRASNVLTDLASVPSSFLVPRLLPGEGHACPSVGITFYTSYLIRLDYGPGRTAWVRAGGRCGDGVSNGRFMSGYGLPVAAAFTSGRWPALSAVTPCSWDSSRTGRAGQEVTLVPPGWQSVRVCPSSGVSASELSDVDAEDVVERVNRLGTAPYQPMTGCSGDDLVPVEQPTKSVVLVVDYGLGRGVRLDVAPGCTPFISNGSIRAVAGSAQQNAILDLLRQ